MRNLIKRFQERYLMVVTLGVMIAGLLFLFFLPRILVVIPAGSVGIVFRPLGDGTDMDLKLGEGAHLILPWNHIEVYNLRLQTLVEPFNVITKDGLAVQATIVTRFRVNPRNVPMLHKNVGSNYVNVMLKPEVAAGSRDVAAKYDAEEFYAIKRPAVQEEILSNVRKQILEKNVYSSGSIELVEVDNILIQAVTLPPIVANAIERKIEQYQRQIEFDYRLQTEAKEARRKEIEGEGVRKLFAGVGTDDVQSYLRLAGINALLELAKSPNAKIVVVGQPNGVPIVLNPDPTNMPHATTAPGPAQKLSK